MSGAARHDPNVRPERGPVVDCHAGPDTGPVADIEHLHQEPAGPRRRLVVNADDLGQSEGINAGIIEAVTNGIVTSASMMVRWPAAASAARWARGEDPISVGLHLDLGEWAKRGDDWVAVYTVTDTSDTDAVAAELDRQLDRFVALMGRPPTHLDSHQHVHMDEPVRALLLDAGRRLGVPVRSLGTIRYCGEYYGQWVAGETNAEAIGFDALLGVLDRLGPGTTELACHPGADDLDDVDSMYRIERAIERRVLCDPRLPGELAARGIELWRFDDRPC